MLGLARYLNLDIDCLAKSLLQLLTSITNRTTMNIHGESQTKILASAQPVREGCGKSKWKFKMAFAMKGGGGLEGVSFAIKLF